MTLDGKPPWERPDEIAPQPLAGIRVLELGTLIAGPMGGRILADFGAEVIKIENPSSPDPMRSWGKVRLEGRGLWWSVQARGKKSVSLDMKSEAGARIFRGLVRDADVLLENLRPGTLERLGFSPEQLWQINEGLVIARVSGYGQTGRNAHKPGYAAVAEAAGGLRHLNGYPDTPPPRAGISLGDSLAALYAVQGILMALYWRDARGGRGQVVDVSLVEACFSLLESAVPDYAAAQHVAGPSGSRLDGIAPSNIYPSADDKWVVIAANQDSVFARLAKALGDPGLAEDPRYRDHVARGEHQDELDDLIAAWVSQRSAAEVISALEEHSVPTSRVNSIEDIFNDPAFREREMLLDLPDPQFGTITHPGIVPKLGATPGSVAWNGPPEGAHTREVLGELGLSEEELDSLAEQGTIT